MAAIQKWEYRQEIFQGAEALNALGAEGWEIAGFFGKDGAFMILKRPIPTRGVGLPAAPAAGVGATPGAGTGSGTAGGRPRPSVGTASLSNKSKEMI